MPTQVTNYQCPACTGPLHFASGSGKLECDYCGSSFEVAEIEALYAEKDAAAAAASAEAEKKQVDKPAEPEEEKEILKDAQPEDNDENVEVEWINADGEDDLPDFPENGTDWGSDAAKMRAYNCPSCGAELICEETTAATACPYCGNPTIVPGQLSGTLRPDFVIPFKLDKEAAKKALKDHYRKNFFLPRVFSTDNHIEEIKGVYVPFWLYDTEVDAEAAFHATRTMVHRAGDEEITTTRHYQVTRGGTARFIRVPADGSSKMPDDYMDSLEPFDYGELKPFSTAYLPGYLADKFDVSAKSCVGRIDQRCRQSTADLLRQDVNGYATVSLRSMQSKVRHGKVYYALMPVWLLNTRWKDKTYLYAMNGQTGKFVGELPSSAGRFWGITGAVTLLITALTTLTGFWAGLVNLFIRIFD